MERQERPWGSWRVLDAGTHHKVKTLTVKPGRRLSLQSHSYRSEHWYVVDGTASCTVDGVETQVPAGGSIDVPIGAKHRLANDADTDLVIVEIQRGSYTGEDDIVRFEDDYGRVPATANDT